jgi:pyridoxal phosphate enzyme (YggS family)
MAQGIPAIRQNFEKIQEKVAKAAQLAGRNPEAVRLVVVTKSQPVENVEEAIRAGARVLGENYPEETLDKIHKLASSNYSFEWHMIGHLQSRKLKIVGDHFNMLHSLDRVDLAAKLDAYLGSIGKKLPVLLEFNVSGEESKGGWDASNEDSWSLLLPDVEQICRYSNLVVNGLMTMPPYLDPPERVRPFFVRLRKFQAYLSREIPNVQFDELSMGTSLDFMVAIEEGATMVRIGTAIFGPRPQKKV